MKRALIPHDFTMLRDLVSHPADADKYHVYVFGALIAWDYAEWDAKAQQVTITDAGRQALHDQDMKLARAKAKQDAQASQFDAEFAAEYVAELEGMVSKTPAARSYLEAAQRDAEQAAQYAQMAQEALTRDDFVAVKNASLSSSRACHSARAWLNDAANLVIKGDKL